MATNTKWSGRIPVVVFAKKRKRAESRGIIKKETGELDFFTKVINLNI